MSGTDREAARELTTHITPQRVYEHARGLPLSIPIEDDSWWACVEQLDLSHHGLQMLDNLTKLTNLRRASFADNELVQIAGLESFFVEA